MLTTFNEIERGAIIAPLLLHQADIRYNESVHVSFSPIVKWSPVRWIKIVTDNKLCLEKQGTLVFPGEMVVDTSRYDSGLGAAVPIGTYVLAGFQHPSNRRKSTAILFKSGISAGTIGFGDILINYFMLDPLACTEDRIKRPLAEGLAVKVKNHIKDPMLPLILAFLFDSKKEG